MKQIILLLILFVSHNIFSQCNGRYESEIFSSTSVTEVEFTDVYDLSAFNSGLDMDVYLPDGDIEQNRPVIIFCHGGTFIGGEKDNPPMIALCEAFAKRGYVTASIEYRLTSPLLLTDSLHMAETVLNAVSDAKAAIRYFRMDYSLNNTFGIDPSQIYIGGYSAGAIIADHVGHFNDLSVAPPYLVSIVNNIGGLEGNSGNPGYSSEVKAVINVAGAIASPIHIDPNDVPIVSVQAIDDGTVPYYCDHALFQSYMLTCCGAGPIHNAADNVGVYNALHTFQSGGHTAPVTAMSSITIPFISDFIYTTLDCYESPSMIIDSNYEAVIYPNPATELINIKYEEKMDCIDLYDLMGRRIMSENIDAFDASLSIEGLSQGTYYLKLTDTRGYSTSHLFFVK